MSKMIACRNCKHYGDNWGSYCDHPELRKPDPIEGDLPSNPLVNRANGGPCGPAARYFEAYASPRFGCRLFSGL